MQIRSKSNLAVLLSKLKGFQTGKVREKLEQYQTDPEIAAEVIWFAGFNKDISGKVIVDLGCGTGVLGIGALIMGAEKVIFVDIDEEAVETAKKNLAFAEEELGVKLSKKAEFVVEDVRKFKAKDVDLVLQNPPFGVKVKHADRVFLEKAMELCPIIYSFHKIESRDFIDEFSRDKGYKMTHFWSFDFPLKMMMKHHKKRIHRIKVGCWRLEKLINK
ncbi:METTL5 family protein [Candidatus Woesearchaeota archaeon]|nr:METTL5 family protein [Candidatus Woesearchaeota archaeon]